jgi:hypothetical protein
MEGSSLIGAMRGIDYDICRTGETALPNGIKLVRLDFLKKIPAKHNAKRGCRQPGLKSNV